MIKLTICSVENSVRNEWLALKEREREKNVSISFLLLMTTKCKVPNEVKKNEISTSQYSKWAPAKLSKFGTKTINWINYHMRSIL